MDKQAHLEKAYTQRNRVNYLVSNLTKSDERIHDALSLAWSLLTWKGVYLSHRIRVRVAGAVSSKGVCMIGIFSNQLGLDNRAGGQFIVGRYGRFEAGYNVRISRGCRIYVNGSLSIGDLTYINPMCIILAQTRITIGRNCAISWNFQAIDGDLHTVMMDGTDKSNAEPITIGDQVWIGANVIVLKGVEIGAHSIVAAGSVVTRSFPPGSLIGGNPARLIRSGVNWK